MQTEPLSDLYPITIIGRGLTGLACGFHLKALGFSDFCIIGPEAPAS